MRNTQSVGLEDLQALVLDEADRLLEMGFAEEVCTIGISNKHSSNTACSAHASRRRVHAFGQHYSSEVEQFTKHGEYT